MPVHDDVSLIPRPHSLWHKIGRWRNRTLEDADSGRVVVNTAGGLESGSEDLNGGNEIVSEAVVQVALLRKKT